MQYSFLLALSATLVSAQVALYERCGGIGYSGTTSCADGAYCKVQNPYYSQCVAGDSSSDAAPAADVKAVSNAATAPIYGQCGGIGWTGATACAAGSSCVVSNAYYSQCLPGSSGSAPTSAAPAPSSAAPKPTTLRTTTTTSKASTPTTAPVTGGIKASFTHYGAGDSFGSPNCNTATAACGFYNNPGFNAAISQNYFGVGPGAGAGPACGTCWRLTPETDSSGNHVSGFSSIVVKINNLCPAQGNPLCSQSGTSGTNQYGANVNFDTCSDDGAAAALFGSSGVGLALGTAVQVDCSQWSGSSSITH